MSAAVVLAGAILLSILVRVRKSLAEELMSQILAAIDSAEQQWIEAGRGALKKEWAVNAVMVWLTTQTRLNWWQKLIARNIIGHVVDAVIAELNDRLGQNWQDKAEEALEELTGIGVPDSA